MKQGVYYHSVGYIPPYFHYDPENQRIILDRILKSGALLSMRNQGRPSNGGFCALDYISLCDSDKTEDYNTGRKMYNGFQQYIRVSLSLVFDKEIVEKEAEILVPILVRNCSLNYQRLREMNFYGECEERYSDLPDEVQVKDRLSLDGLIALSFPTENFSRLYSLRSRKKRVELLKDEIKCLKEILDNHGYDMSIYDIDTFDEMTDENIEKLILKS